MVLTKAEQQKLRSLEKRATKLGKDAIKLGKEAKAELTKQMKKS